MKDSNNNINSHILKSSVPQNITPKSSGMIVPSDCNKSFLNHVAHCSSCNRPIVDRYLHNIADRFWHVQCLRCADCDIPLSERCFERDGQLFCFKDYRKRVYTKCSLCLNVILPSELVRHSRNSSVYHLKCFFCVVCRKQLSTGEEYCLLDNFKPVCKEDFHHIFKEISNISSMNLDSDSSKMDIPIIKEEQAVPNDKEQISSNGESHRKEIFNNPNSPNTVIKSNQKFSFSDIPNYTQNPVKRIPRDAAELSCQETNNRLHSNSDVLIPNDNKIIEPNNPLNPKESRYSENLTELAINPDYSNFLGMKIGNAENLSMDSQLLTPEQSDKQNKNQMNLEKEHELCSLDDDLKSSFSPASSVDCPVKEEEQETIDGNGSEQSFQDDQRSVCPESRESTQSGNNGTKRRGPRTTIKAKQLDTLKAAFAATPKPTRHVREQLAQDTGLTMRVIQVWFQNRRSKERRMKQLSAMGARRPFFRNARRMRSLSRGFGPDDLNPEAAQMMTNPNYHGYFGENPEFCNAIAALGNSFPSGNNYPMGPPGMPREFFLPSSNPGVPTIQPPFLTINQPTSLHNQPPLSSSDTNQPLIVPGQMENGYNSSEHFNSTNCNSPDTIFSQPNFNSVSPHNILHGPGYICGAPITSGGASGPQAIQNVSSLHFVQAPIVGMESW